MNNNVRKITDGAMMCAIVGVLLLINRQFAGFFEESFLFLFPLPMVFYAAKYGFKNSWLTFTGIVLLTIIIGTPQTLFYVASESLIGMVYGGGVHKGTDMRKLVILTMIISVLANVFSAIIYAKFFGYDLVQEVTEIQAMLTSTFQNAGVAMPTNINMTNFLFTALVVSVILTGILQAFVTHILARTLLHRLHFKVEPATPTYKYFPTVWSGYLAFALVCIFFYVTARPLANEVLQNSLVGFGMCGVLYLTFYGMIALLVYAAVKMPKFRLLALLFSFFLMFSLPMVLITLGFLSITTDWHKRLLEEKTNAPKVG